ncbi:hypothetical protein NDS46_31555 (plasmid) [Paenibacillus thiaminolyticus]|uniref:hypothetical protein n=1 Tax=Paenibacillus thiaminolyticus TaxID=49283 RepID=UPI0023306036|nr:hypothetical protein [Paenibacillus thiaminolyticus]WCF11495.1 hypothetical protein NDS46_31555 [Paenibacillus thiaminolyticus]
MPTVHLYEIEKEVVDCGSHSIDSRRNYLGFVYKKDLEVFIQDFTQACAEKGEIVRPYKRYHKEQYERLTFSFSPLIAEVISLSIREISQVSLLFEEPIVGYDGTTSLKDEERLLVFVGFNVQKKALTRIRKFLYEIIEVRKRTA